MTLSQLRYFVEVCRWGNNITRAGEELHISQPSISNAIKDLEQEFGVLLFKRANGRLHITADGERFLLKAHELLQKADEMALTMWGAGNRKLVIGLTPMIGAFIFPGLCQGFLALYPDTEFEVHEHGAIETHELLRRKEIDVALNINAAADTTSFHAKHMMLSQYCLCVHRNHPMAGRPSVTVEELTGYTPPGNNPDDPDSGGDVESIRALPDGTLWLQENNWAYIYDLPEDFDPEKVDVSFASEAGEILVCRAGRGLDFDEALAKRILTEDEVDIDIAMAEGDESCTCWGCDITYDYIKINGDYRT